MDLAALGGNLGVTGEKPLGFDWFKLSCLGSSGAFYGQWSVKERKDLRSTESESRQEAREAGVR